MTIRRPRPNSAKLAANGKRSYKQGGKQTTSKKKPKA